MTFIQTNVLGHFKNKYEQQHKFMDSTRKSRIVIEQDIILEKI